MNRVRLHSTISGLCGGTSMLYTYCLVYILKAHNHLLAKFLICQFTLPIEHI